MHESTDSSVHSHPAPPPASAGQDFFSSIDHETHFYLVRHGQSEGNAQRIFQGRLDLPLDATGRAQAADLGAWLSDKGIETVLSSPLIRAYETAGIVAKICGLGVSRSETLLEEIDTGIFTGISYDQAGERFPEPFANFDGMSWDAVPGADHSETLYMRAMDAWRLMLALAGEGKKAIACVSHGGFLQWLVKATFGFRTWEPLLPTDNCAIFELVVAPTSLSARPFMQWKRFNYQVPNAAPPIDPVF